MRVVVYEFRCAQASVHLWVLTRPGLFVPF